MQRSANYTVEQTTETKIKSTITLPTELVAFMLSTKFKPPHNTRICGTCYTTSINWRGAKMITLHWPKATTKASFTLSAVNRASLLVLLKDVKRQWQEQTTELPADVTKALVSELNYQNAFPGEIPDLAHELMSMTTTLRKACDSLHAHGSSKEDTLRLLRVTTAVGVRAMSTHGAPLRK